MEHIDRICAPDYVPSDDDVSFVQKNLDEDKQGIEEVTFSYS
jgi:hypothetical protein